MKKYIVSVIMMLIAYNCCAMEYDPFDRSIEYDEKCWWVAQYLHKYPQGKNEQEAKKIEWFLRDEISERVTVLPWLVTKYKNILVTQDAQRWLDIIYQEEHAKDLRKRIFEQALSYSAQEYYVAHNSLKFLEIYHPDVSRYSSSAIERFYKPYFLDEINEKNLQIHFSNLRDIPKNDYSMASLVNAEGKEVFHIPMVYKCELKSIEKLIDFLDKKDERVHNFNIMFNDHIEQLSHMDKEDGIENFIFLLERFKGLTKRVIYLYTGRDRLT